MGESEYIGKKYQQKNRKNIGNMGMGISMPRSAKVSLAAFSELQHHVADFFLLLLDLINIKNKKINISSEVQI